MTYEPGSTGATANGAEASMFDVAGGQYSSSAIVRGWFAKRTSPGTATKFTALVAKPFGGGGFRRSKTSTTALPTMCPAFEHGGGPT